MRWCLVRCLVLGGVGRAEGTETWSAEGRNAILVTRTGGRGQEWDREVPAAGRTNSWRLSPGLGPGAGQLCAQKKTPVFQARARKLFALDFFFPLTSQAAQHQAQLWHMSRTPFW